MKMADDNVQHGIDDNPRNDAEKGAALGGVGGAVVGGLAGGPVGAVVGAVAGAVTSGAGVAAVDRVDNDNTVTGVGTGATRDAGDTVRDATDNAGASAHNTAALTVNTIDDVTPGNDVPGVQTGGRAVDGTPDSRGITEKAADAITGDRTDDKTGKTV
jgi:outer membrane lipoprotein SlyB